MWAYLRKHWKGLLISSLAIGTAIFCIYFPPMMLGFMIGSIASTNAFAVLGAGALPGAAVTVALIASATVASLSALVFGCGSLITQLGKRYCCPTTNNNDEPEMPDLESSYSIMSDPLGVSGEEPETQPITSVNHYSHPLTKPESATKNTEEAEQQALQAMNFA